MTGKAHAGDTDLLKADIASLREAIASLAAGVKDFAGKKAAGTDAEGEGHGAWTDSVHKLNSSRIQVERVVKGLAAEVERHPLWSISAAFGLGYMLAKLLYRGSKQ